MDAEVSALDDLADRYQGQEEAEAKARAEPEQTEAEKPPDHGAENMAAVVVRAMELGWRGIESRIEYGDGVYKEGRENLGPLFAKYGIGASVDRVPMGDELRAGWWLGALIKKTWLEVRALWETDKKKQDKKQHGEKRESAAQEPAYPVSGEVGAWEKSMFEASRPNPETGGAGGPVGYE